MFFQRNSFYRRLTKLSIDSTTLVISKTHKRIKIHVKIFFEMNQPQIGTVFFILTALTNFFSARIASIWPRWTLSSISSSKSDCPDHKVTIKTKKLTHGCNTHRLGAYRTSRKASIIQLCFLPNFLYPQLASKMELNNEADIGGFSN